MLPTNAPGSDFSLETSGSASSIDLILVLLTRVFITSTTVLLKELVPLMKVAKAKLKAKKVPTPIV